MRFFSLWNHARIKAENESPVPVKQPARYGKSIRNVWYWLSEFFELAYICNKVSLPSIFAADILEIIIWDGPTLCKDRNDCQIICSLLLSWVQLIGFPINCLNKLDRRLDGKMVAHSNSKSFGVIISARGRITFLYTSIHDWSTYYDIKMNDHIEIGSLTSLPLSPITGSQTEK